jgi:hypothetical protein
VTEDIGEREGTGESVSILKEQETMFVDMLEVKG